MRGVAGGCGLGTIFLVLIRETLNSGGGARVVTAPAGSTEV